MFVSAETCALLRTLCGPLYALVTFLPPTAKIQFPLLMYRGNLIYLGCRSVANLSELIYHQIVDYP